MEHFRHILLFEFNRGAKAAEAARNICVVYGDNAIGESTARKWFSRFKEGRFDMNDTARTGRPSGFDEDRLNMLIHNDPRQCTRELANAMNCDHSTIVRHLHSMGKVQKSGVWIPHALSPNQKNQRVAICASLLARHQLARDQHRPFLSNIVTGDEKWCLYINIRKRKEWLSPNKKATPRTKANAHPQKIMLCIWWDKEGVLYYELLPQGETITADIYCHQLRRLADSIQEKRPRLREVMLLHDNARPHSANLTKLTIQELGWEVIPHPPYSPDLAPSDFHLFRSLSNNLQGNSFPNENALRTWLDDFFIAKPQDFYRRGIEKLLQRWQSVVDSGGEYIVDD